MKHTKNILKSLLIMIVAISLFTVSCSKDEGGSKPTDPTPITLGVDELNAIVSGFVTTQASWEVDSATILKPQNGEGSMSVTVKTAFASLDDLKKSLTTYSSGGITISATANSTFGPDAVNKNTAAKFDITINIGNNNFAEGVNGPYKVNGKIATLTLTITPTNKWDGK